MATLAPDVARRIVELHFADNECVHKGDLLMAIDRTKYAVAITQAEAPSSVVLAAGMTDTVQIEDSQGSPMM